MLASRLEPAPVREASTLEIEPDTSERISSRCSSGDEYTDDGYSSDGVDVVPGRAAAHARAGPAPPRSEYSRYSDAEYSDYSDADESPAASAWDEVGGEESGYSDAASGDEADAALATVARHAAPPLRQIHSQPPGGGRPAQPPPRWLGLGLGEAPPPVARSLEPRAPPPPGPTPPRGGAAPWPPQPPRALPPGPPPPPRAPPLPGMPSPRAPAPPRGAPPPRAPPPRAPPPPTRAPPPHGGAASSWPPGGAASWTPQPPVGALPRPREPLLTIMIEPLGPQPSACTRAFATRLHELGIACDVT